nr:DUF2020 domain-containing protein [Amycolatopsis xylanica]
MAAGCSPDTSAGPASAAAPSAAPSSSAAPEIPPEPKPSADGPCPFLEKSFVAQANGQQVSKIRISADKPHPTCFFYALSGKLQLTVRVYSGDSAVARALVDQAAPVATSNPASEPAGWNGGYLSTDSGAVYAVWQRGSAIVVTTNQKQSVKARTVAVQAIGSLKL